MNTGTITQIIGPIVDVHFADGVPALLNALVITKEALNKSIVDFKEANGTLYTA